MAIDTINSLKRLHIQGLLSSRTCNALLVAGLEDFEELASRTDHQILSIPNVGPRMLGEIRAAAELLAEDAPGDDERAAHSEDSVSTPGPRLVDATRRTVIDQPEVRQLCGVGELEKLRDARLLSARTCNIFLRNGFSSLPDLDTMSDGDLMSYRGVGWWTVREIRNVAALVEAEQVA